MNKRKQPTPKLAVVGMACWYPGAQNVNEFWENILAKRQQFRRMPDQRLPLGLYHHPNKQTPDKTYGTEAAVLEGFEFDWRGRRIPKQVFESTDIVHWLALDVALRAMEDSRLDLPRLQSLQTGVILGNTLTGEWTRTNAMRMRWPYIERVLQETAAQRGLSGEAFTSYTKVVEEAFKSVFPSPNEDTLAGALSNTIAGRVCNFLDFHGGGYTVDGACSSSLLAIITAARSLVSGDLDVAFAGGIDISLDTFELIGFAKTGALTPDDMRVYDKRANGFIPGEGCGFVVLKRLDDAIKDQDQIYAVLNGWGISSDGKGGITAPAVSGQASAVGKAYTMAGYGIEQCSFIEGHGTGTTVGDKVEITALTEVLGTQQPLRPIALTSLKSIVGHTKAAAGIGAFIKAVIAVNQRVVPPMAGVEDPNPLFQDKARHFYPAAEGHTLDPAQSIKAGISAMGFGGINSHTTVESYGPPAEHLRSFLDEKYLLSSADKAEVLVFSAASQAQLQKKIELTLQCARRISRSELIDLAADLARHCQSPGAYRAAVVVSRPEEAWQALSKLKNWLDSPVQTQKFQEQLDGSLFLCLGHSSKAPRIGFLFPGQGAQKLNMGRKLQLRYEWARDLALEAQGYGAELSNTPILEKIFCALYEDSEARAKILTATEHAQPAITLSNVLWFENLKRLGLQPHVVGGHSLGELSALYAAKALSLAQLMKLATKRGQLMASPRESAGSMIYLAADAKLAQSFIDQATGYAQIANRNAPDQTVIAGDPACLKSILEAATQKGLRCGPIAVSNAFHSRYMETAAADFKVWLKDHNFQNPQLEFIRGTDGQGWTEGANVADYLSHQMIEQVDFIALAERMQKQVDLIIEVGPGNILTGLIKRINQNSSGSIQAFACESRPGHDLDIKMALAAAFVRGSRIRWDELYQNRLIRPFINPDDRIFIESPTERPLKFSHLATPAVAPDGLLFQTPAVTQQPPPKFQVEIPAPTVAQARPIESPAKVAAMQVELKPAEPAVEQVLARIVEELTGFEAATIKPQLKVLDDLNMDSIKASELVANAAMHYGIAGELEALAFTNATIGEIAEAIRAKLPAAGLSKDTAVSQVAPTPLTLTLPTPVTTPSPQVQTQAAPRASKIAEMTRAKNMNPWVRNFSEVFVSSTTPQVANPGLWHKLRVLLVTHGHEDQSCHSLVQALQTHGADVRLQIIDGLNSTQRLDIAERDATIILLRGEATEFEHCVSLLSSIGQARWPRGHRLLFVQCDDGQFAHTAASNSILSFKAFAQSLSHERPDLFVTSLAIPEPSYAQSNWLLDALSQELTQAEPLIVAGFDTHSQRIRPELVLDQPREYSPRSLHWTPDDVVLVTGGAKGITAACALAVARQIKVKMALVGSSPLTDAEAQNPDHPICSTLLKFREAGLVAEYYSCDIKNPSQVRDLLAKVKQDLGDIRGLIHGAGTNQPRPVVSVSAAEALKEMAPKVVGLQNLLTALPSESLQLVIGLSSVIGVVGMPGNAWYGFANETLDLMLRRYAKKHAHLQVQTLAYSVWAEVGMGARMGSDKNLEDKAISSIVPDEGIQRFQGLFHGKSRDQQTIICSRMGTIGKTEVSTENQRPFMISFNQQIVHQQKDVEVIGKVHLTLDSHPYLKDHNYKGAYLMPTVYGLEAMAQIVDRLAPLSSQQSLRLENIQLSRPITVSAQGCDIEIYALRLESTEASAPIRIRTGIRCALSGYKFDHFSADFVLQACTDEKIKDLPAYAGNIALDPQRQLYGSVLFQGPRFQRLRNFQYLESDNETAGCTIFTALAKTDDLQKHLLGDPYFRDSLLQSAQIIIPQNQCLPVSIGSLELYRDYRETCERHCFTDVHKADEKTYLATVSVFADDGRILERMTDYRLQFLEKRPQLPKAMDLIQASETPLKQVEVSPFSADSGDLLAPYREIAGRLMIDAEPNGPQGQSVFVHRFIPDFKAFANLGRSIYFANFFNWMGSAREMSSLPVLDKLRALTETGRWGQVTNWASIEVFGECRNKDRVVEARLWCGRVTGSKNSSATLAFDWVSKGEDGIEERIASGHMGFTWVEILDHGIVAPAEFPVYYRDFIASMVAKDDRKDTYLPAREPYRQLDQGATLFKAPEGPKASIKLTQKIFETSLYDSNLVGNLYFGNYSIWMGKIRDHFFYDMAPELYRGIGEQGELICTKSRIQHLREAMPFDEILVIMSLKNLYSQGLELNFEYFKICPNDQLEKLATATQTALWTKPGQDGEKVSSEWPELILKGLWQRIDSKSADAEPSDSKKDRVS